MLRTRSRELVRTKLQHLECLQCWTTAKESKDETRDLTHSVGLQYIRKILCICNADRFAMELDVRECLPMIKVQPVEVIWRESSGTRLVFSVTTSHSIDMNVQSPSDTLSISFVYYEEAHSILKVFSVFTAYPVRVIRVDDGIQTCTYTVDRNENLYWLETL